MADKLKNNNPCGLNGILATLIRAARLLEYLKEEYRYGTPAFSGRNFARGR